MEQIIQAIPAILLRALPTFLLVIVLHWYLKKVLVQPLERVLEERRKKTAGAVESAEQTLAQIAAKMREYEKALEEARSGIFLEQEANRQNLAGQQARAIEAAREKAIGQAAVIKAQIAAEVEEARIGLAAESDRLADRMAEAMLRRRAS